MTDDDTLASLKQLPADDVGVMFHIGDNNLIALAEKCLAERIGHEIDALGCTTGENDFGTLLRMDKPLHTLTRSFVQIGGILTQEMNTSMHIGIVMQISVCQLVDDAERLLSSSPVVEINKRLAVNRTIEYGEILSD